MLKQAALVVVVFLALTSGASGEKLDPANPFADLVEKPSPTKFYSCGEVDPPCVLENMDQLIQLYLIHFENPGSALNSLEKRACYYKILLREELPDCYFLWAAEDPSLLPGGNQ